MSGRFHLAPETLLYIYDPMCSWCWGYRNTLEKLKIHLPENTLFRYIVGGLAEDTDSPMPADMQHRIESTWKQIETAIPCTNFNYDFWRLCKPRRSTYPSCRAVLAAAKYDKYEDMLLAIQCAYYLQARNPSDYEVLYDLAEEIGINRNDFESEIHSDSTANKLQDEIIFSRSIGVDSFPSLVYFKNESFYPIELDYNNYDISLDHIKSL